MQNIIEVNNLSKRFKDNRVLNGLNFSVQKGRVVGILGNNGAGKTTLIQILLGYLKADSGKCSIFGDESPELSSRSKHRIGYVPQEAELISWMKVKQLIAYTKSFYSHWNDQLVSQLVDEWKLTGSTIVDKLSVGQKQKLAIILAVAHEPDLLLLDEPVASLDPVARRDFIKKLIEMNLDKDRTIIFSTHITSDLERVAAEVMIMKEGVCYFQGEIDDLKERVVKLHIHSKNELSDNLPIQGVLQSSINGKSATVTVENIQAIDIDSLAEQLEASIRTEPLSLEDIFVELHS